MRKAEELAELVIGEAGDVIKGGGEEGASRR